MPLTWDGEVVDIMAGLILPRQPVVQRDREACLRRVELHDGSLAVVPGGRWISYQRGETRASHFEDRVARPVSRASDRSDWSRTFAESCIAISKSDDFAVRLG